MEARITFEKLEKTIINDNKLVFTMISYAAVILILTNMIFVNSHFLGSFASIAYLVINATFLGGAFFKEEPRWIRFALGSLVLTATIGLIGWIVMIVYNLDHLMSTLALCIIAAVCSIANKLSRHEFKMEFLIEK